MALLVIGTICAVTIAYFIPKRLTKGEMYNTALFTALLATICDVFLDLKYDLYGYFTKGVNWGSLPILIIFYPAVGIIFLNYYPYNHSLLYKVFYILAFSLATVLLEYIALQTDLFYHNEWRLIYSVFCYPFVYLSILASLKVYRVLNRS